MKDWSTLFGMNDQFGSEGDIDNNSVHNGLAYRLRLT